MGRLSDAESLLTVLRRRFEPIDMPGCEAWWRSDRGIKVNAGRVEEWIDQTDNRFVATESTQSQRPTYVTSGALPLLRFTVAELSVLSFGPSGALAAITGDYTIAAMHKFTALVSSSEGAVIDTSSTGTDGSTVGQVFSTTARRGFKHQGVGWIYWGDATLNPEWWIMRHDGAGNADADINGVAQSQQALANNVAPTSFPAIGATNPTPNIASDVDIYEIALWSRRLTDNEVATLNQYFSNRYGL